MKAKKMDRLLALLLAAVMVVGMLPMAVLAAEEEYDPATDDSWDYPLQVKMLTVNSHDNQGNRPAYMLDGDYETQWVAGWGNGGEGPAAECAEDNWIQITLPEPIEVQGLRYQARDDVPDRGYASGGFGGWKLQTSDDGDTWTNTVYGNWGVEGAPENETGNVAYEGTYYKPVQSEWYYAGLEEPVETRYIRLTATQLYAYEEENINYGSCAEIRLVMAEGAQAPTEVAYDCILAEDGPENGGVYAIFTNRGEGSLEKELDDNRLLYYSGTGATTGKVSAGAISDDDDRQYLDLNHDRTFFPVETQLWQAVEVEDGWLLKSLAGGRNMYLELSLNGNSTHADAKVNYKPQTLTIKAASKKNSYKILQQDGETCCSLNWSGGGYCTHDKDNDFALRFYEWKKAEMIETEGDVYTVDGIADQTYTGEAITPAVTVQKNGAEMAGGYTVEYGNNIEVGEATVAIVVNGCIVGETTFNIVPPLPDVYTIAAIPEQTYTGSAIEPAVEVQKNDAPITEGFEVEYGNNVEVGEATVAIKVDGETVAETTFKIVPAPTTGEEPENPGEEPEDPGDNTGDDVPSTPSKPSTPVTKPTIPAEEPTEELDDPDVPLAELPMGFEDVTEDDWFYDEVKYNVENGLMKGFSSTQFGPEFDTTRGMIVTILHRVEKEPEAATRSNFTDVADDEWYTAGIAWGRAEEIARGMGDGTFRPMTNVTREQMVAFLYRYAQYKGYDVTAKGELDDFRDGGATSAWATECVRWAIGAGLLQGKGGNILDPRGTATRAEAAAILMRFCENMME